MELFYYHARGGNLGDDLNASCWDRLWPDFRRSRAADWLVGIGSILDGRLNHLPGTKLIMGSGYRPNKYGQPDLRDCRFGFVRGPLSCRALGIDGCFAITDTAALLGAQVSSSAGTDERVGFVPHFGTGERFDCRRLAEMAGVRLIDPSGPVDVVMDLIAKSPRIVTEAMHGAILADAMGVPWMRISLFNRRLEGQAKVDFKWQDWGASLGVDVSPAVECAMPWPGEWAFTRLVKGMVVERSLRRAAKAIRGAVRAEDWRLSDRQLLQSKVMQIREKIAEAAGLSA